MSQCDREGDKLARPGEGSEGAESELKSHKETTRPARVQNRTKRKEGSSPGDPPVLHWGQLARSQRLLQITGKRH